MAAEKDVDVDGVSQNEEAAQPSLSSSIFAWVLPALKSRRTIKTTIRCCVVTASTLVLLVDNKTLNSMGQAGFFASLVSVMLPPTLALSLFVFVSITLLLGMLIGWAWGCAAMASGLHVRSAALLASQELHAQASLVQGAIPAATQLQIFVFHGMFLDPRSSAVHGVFLFIGAFALGLVRAFIPKLALLSIFGTIVLDVMCSYGPLFPTAQYTLPKLFLIPTCYYLAIAIASLILIFPESMNHVWLTTLGDSYLAPTLKLISLQSQALSSRPSDHKSWSAIASQGTALRRGLIAGSQGLTAQVGFVDLEVSVGRLGPGDLKKISGELQSLTARAAGLLAFIAIVNDSNTADDREKATVEKHLKDGKPKMSDRFSTIRNQVCEREARHGHDLDSLIPILASTSAELRDACEYAVKCTADWFVDCNSGRWAKVFSFSSAHTRAAKIEERHKRLVDAHRKLENAVEQFVKSERVKLLKPYERFFDPKTGQVLESIRSHPHGPEMFAVRSLFVCFLFSDTLVAFAKRVTKLMTFLVNLDEKRPGPRVWMPSGFGMLGRKIMSKYGVDDRVNPLAMGSATDPTKFSSDSGSSTQGDDDDDDEIHEPEPPRNPDALTPKTALGKFGYKLGSIIAFFRSDEAIFAFRVGIVSVALWIPAVCVSSAWFNYNNKGLWALIMAQVGLATYAGDQIVSFLLRIVGTALGLLLGMVVWYIGAGHGNGNPYGIVIATTVFVAPFLFARIAAPPQYLMLYLMTAVTIVFVVGYSWIDAGHLAVISNLGKGVQLSWKRALLVIIGFTAGFIVMIFPRPTSSRTLVRKTLAASMQELGNIFAAEVEAFLAEEARARNGDFETYSADCKEESDNLSPKEKRARKMMAKVMAVATRLQTLAPSLQTARFDPQLRGIWPHEQYELLYATIVKLLSSLVLLGSAFARLDPKWCSILVHRTPFMNPNLLSDVFTTTALLSNALAGAHPLPASLPMLRDRLVYHERHSAAHGGRSLPHVPSPKSDGSSDSETELDQLESQLDPDHPAKIDGSTIGLQDLTLDLLSDDQLPAHSTAILALSNIIGMADEVSTIVRSLCGETNLHGLDLLRQEYLAREEMAISSRFGGYQKA